MMREAQAGFSLPEVTLALGLLAGALISLAGVFVHAERLVNSGKQQTTALSCARDVLEEMDGLHFSGVYEIFGLDGSASSYTVDSRTNAYASKWQLKLDQELGTGRAEIVLESVEEGGTTPNLSAARCIRVAVTVFWQEGPRDRQVRLATVKM